VGIHVLRRETVDRVNGHAQATWQDYNTHDRVLPLPEDTNSKLLDSSCERMPPWVGLRR
jgi:hypothetical protein